MFEIEYGADYSDSTILRGKESDWDWAMTEMSSELAGMVDRRLITPEEFTEGMEWVTGVVVEDHGVRVPATFGGLTIALTLTE